MYFQLNKFNLYYLMKISRYKVKFTLLNLPTKVGN